MEPSIEVRRASERGRSQFGWLDSRHTFSFGRYYDGRHLGFGSLRVLNEDRISGGAGFDTNAHKDLEILSYVIEGALVHKDTAGNEQIVRAGDVQMLSCGRGVEHSEMNNSRRDPVHIIQVWIMPKVEGLDPSYEQRAFPDELKRGHLCLIASSDGRGESVTVHQDISIYSGLLDTGDSVAHDVRPGRRTWVQAVRGEVSVNQKVLSTGDGAGLEGDDRIGLRAIRPTEVLLFDMQ
ncbi:MAG: pirin family protein [Pseudomonadota bacterium]